MKSLFDFIVKPVNKRYDNEIKIGDKSLITNANTENFRAVSNMAEVVSTPSAYATPIKKGDIIVIHHNVFRSFFDIRGKRKDSRSKFIDDLYFCSPDQVYLYKNSGDWKTFQDRCFVKPIKNSDSILNRKEDPYVGILKIGNNSLEASRINPGDMIGFKPGAEWEFFIDEERLYCMKSNDIVIKYGHKENKEEYNPSWANSS